MIHSKKEAQHYAGLQTVEKALDESLGL